MFCFYRETGGKTLELYVSCHLQSNTLRLSCHTSDMVLSELPALGIGLFGQTSPPTGDSLLSGLPPPSSWSPNHIMNFTIADLDHLRRRCAIVLQKKEARNSNIDM
jgi:hypothetical protein